MSKLIRVSDKTFKKIVSMAGKLQAKHGKFVSADDVWEFLFAHHGKTMKSFLKKMSAK